MTPHQGQGINYVLDWSYKWITEDVSKKKKKKRQNQGGPPGRVEKNEKEKTGGEKIQVEGRDTSMGRSREPRHR